MENGSTPSPYKWEIWKIVVITFIAVLILLIAFYLIGGTGTETEFSLRQFIGILVAAALSGVVTLLLLKGQTETMRQQREGEAQKDKDVKIYSNKIAAFSSFNETVWQNDLDEADPKKTNNTIKTIRKELFSKVLLYLDSSEIDRIVEIVKNRGGQQLPVILSSIVGILNKNADETLSNDFSGPKDDRSYHLSCQTLWNEFSNWINSGDESIDDEKPVEVIEGAITADQLKSSEKTFSLQPWHFSMWSGVQIDYLCKGNNELSLVEYGEVWRTNQVKQIKPEDIVFLFRGSWRYSGVFKALGWRVFYYSTDSMGRRTVTEKTSDGIPPMVVTNGIALISEVEDKLKKYDIYECFRDNSSTSCANVVVDELSFIPEGVIMPKGTYRKTISRYDRGYAIMLLDIFMKTDASCRARIEKKIPGFLQNNNL